MTETELIWNLIQSGGLPGVVGLSVWLAVRERTKAGKDRPPPDPTAAALTEMRAIRENIREDVTEMRRDLSAGLSHIGERVAKVEAHIENLRGKL